MAKKKAPAMKVSVGIASCEIYSTEPMRCPLCGEDVRPKTRHECVTRSNPRRKA